MAKLYFRYGAMNSGKSTALLQAAYNYEERGQKVLLAKPAIDTKAADQIESRLGMSRTVDFLLAPGRGARASAFAREAARVLEDIRAGAWRACSSMRRSSSPPDQVDDLFRIAVLDDIPVLAYGIRTDFRTDAFPGSRRLLEIAHTLEELKTICRCGRKAIFNGRVVGGRFVFDGDQVAIDTASAPVRTSR